MKLVVIESPYAGDVEANVRYARRCVLDSLRRGEAPYASHLFFTQEGILNDLLPDERKLGIEAGLAWGTYATRIAIYLDRGLSEGMEYGIIRHMKRGGAEFSLRSVEGFDRAWRREDRHCSICRRANSERLCDKHRAELQAFPLSGGSK